MEGRNALQRRMVRVGLERMTKGKTSSCDWLRNELSLRAYGSCGLTEGLSVAYMSALEPSSNSKFIKLMESIQRSTTISDDSEI